MKGGRWLLTAVFGDFVFLWATEKGSRKIMELMALGIEEATFNFINSKYFLVELCSL